MIYVKLKGDLRDAVGSIIKSVSGALILTAVFYYYGPTIQNDPLFYFVLGLVGMYIGERLHRYR